jgi:hypothetical protein
VQDFLSTVEEIERLTRLDFGDAVRAADIRAGSGEAIEVMTEKELPLRPSKPAPRRRNRSRLRDNR